MILQGMLKHARNPMTDADLVGKFRSMAAGQMQAAQMDELVETVFRLDTLDDIGKLTQRMVFGRP